MYEGMIAETEVIDGHGGDEVPVYVARPLGPGPFPTMVMLHHRDGWDFGSKEIARRIAANGIVCVLPHLHHREAPGEPAAVAAAVAGDAGGIPDDRCVGDVRAALTRARKQPYSNGKVGVIGFCSGGRQAFIAAGECDFDTAVICYGTRINPAKHQANALMPHAALDHAADIDCSVFAIFGENDHIATPDDAAEIGAALEALGIDHRIRIFPDAGHAFFSTERASYNPEAATQGWQDIFTWISERLT